MMPNAVNEHAKSAVQIADAIQDFLSSEILLLETCPKFSKFHNKAEQFITGRKLRRTTHFASPTLCWQFTPPILLPGDGS